MRDEVRGGKSWVLAAVFVMAAGSLPAATGPEVKVQMTGSIQSVAGTGATWVSLEDGTRVAPGQRIRYQVDLTNHGEQPARKPTALGPVPAGTAYIKGSATTGKDLKVDFSLDGGKTFSEKPTVTVTGKDGTTRTVPAPPDRYTTIRWTWGTPLAPGATATVAYQVKVR